MIQVDRNRQINGRHIHPGPVWQAKADAETATAKQEGANHAAKDSVYADDRVRAAMEALTHFKCTYCEISLVGFDWDIEHFRPKGRVTERRRPSWLLLAGL